MLKSHAIGLPTPCCEANIHHVAVQGRTALQTAAHQAGGVPPPTCSVEDATCIVIITCLKPPACGLHRYISLWLLKEGDEWFTMLNVLLKLFTCFPQWLKEPKRLGSRWMNSCFGPAGSITFRPGAPQCGRVALGTESKSQHEGWERSSLNALRKSESVSILLGQSFHWHPFEWLFALSFKMFKHDRSH